MDLSLSNQKAGRLTLIQWVPLVHRIDVAVDCGPVVNPGPLEAQIQGAVALGVSTTLFEEV